MSARLLEELPVESSAEALASGVRPVDPASAAEAVSTPQPESKSVPVLPPAGKTLPSAQRRASPDLQPDEILALDPSVKMATKTNGGVLVIVRDHSPAPEIAPHSVSLNPIVEDQKRLTQQIAALLAPIIPAQESVFFAPGLEAMAMDLAQSMSMARNSGYNPKMICAYDPATGQVRAQFSLPHGALLFYERDSGGENWRVADEYFVPVVPGEKDQDKGLQFHEFAGWSADESTRVEANVLAGTVGALPVVKKKSTLVICGGFVLYHPGQTISLNNKRTKMEDPDTWVVRDSFHFQPGASWADRKYGKGLTVANDLQVAEDTICAATHPGFIRVRTLQRTSHSEAVRVVPAKS